MGIVGNMSYSINSDLWVRPDAWPDIPDIGSTDGVVYVLCKVIDTLEVTSEFAVDCDIDGGTGNYIISNLSNTSISDIVGSGSQSMSLSYSDYGDLELYKGYKAVLLKVEAEGSGVISSINFKPTYIYGDYSANSSSSLLEIIIHLPMCDTLYINNTTLSSNLTHYNLEHINILSAGLVSDFSDLLENCRGLRCANINGNSSLTNMSNMFHKCYSLTDVSFSNIGGVENINSLFHSCLSLVSVPLFDTSSVTDMGSMFYSCYSLTSVPLFDTSSVTDMGSMFYNCFSLMTVPLFNTVSVTDMSYMLRSCHSLLRVPSFNTSNVTNMNSMFRYCDFLSSIHLPDISNVTSFGHAFSNCYSLSEIRIDSAMVSGTSLSNIFSNFGSLIKLTITDLDSSINISNQRIFGSDLEAFGDSIKDLTGLTSQSVTMRISQAESIDETIFTDKNWTIVEV